MKYQFIETTSENGVCRILLNRPEKQNALHRELIAELNQVFTQLKKDKSVNFVILEGKGKSFCSGADLNWFDRATKLSIKENREQFELLARMLLKLHNLPQVTIAMGSGNIFGGGIGLLASCDFVILEESAILAFSEVHWGLVPATILPFVASRITRQQAKRLMFTGHYFSSDEALKIGLADFVFTEDNLKPGLHKLLNDLQKPVAGAVLSCKKLINEVYADKIKTEDFESTAKILSTQMGSKEAKERIGEFIKKSTNK